MAENQHNEITGRLTLSYLSDSKETAELKYPDTEQCAIFFIYLYFMYDVIIKIIIEPLLISTGYK